MAPLTEREFSPQVACCFRESARLIHAALGELGAAELLTGETLALDVKVILTPPCIFH